MHYALCIKILLFRCHHGLILKLRTHHTSYISLVPEPVEGLTSSVYSPIIVITNSLEPP